MEGPSDDAKRDIWVLGFRDSDERPESALARVFGIDSVSARRLIASMPAVVKREVSAEKAEPIVQALKGIGARVALVPTGASKPPPRTLSSNPPAGGQRPPAAAPKPASGGFGDIESRGIDFGSPAMPPAAPAAPSASPAPPLRDSLPQPQSAPPPPATGREPVDAPALRQPPGPAPIEFLEPQPVPESPAPPPSRGTLAARVLGAVVAAAGAGGLFLATGLPGSVFGAAPDWVGLLAAAASIASLLVGVQILVGAALFDVVPLRRPMIALALVLGGAVSATGFLLHQVDPAELARQERAETMAAIREGRMPEARLFLQSPRAQLEGMDRPAAGALVEAVYAAGARQVYVIVDYEVAPDLGEGLAISMPLTPARRQAVASAIRARIPGAPSESGEWWLIPLR